MDSNGSYRSQYTISAAQEAIAAPEGAAVKQCLRRMKLMFMPPCKFESSSHMNDNGVYKQKRAYHVPDTADAAPGLTAKAGLELTPKA
ncbi:MAG: hypothetical protein E7330_01390 [Clostridiales bacterium]|nr:hypothetical protein [Clostridiales bacterium]